jgi:hypothetical protein
MRAVLALLLVSCSSKKDAPPAPTPPPAAPVVVPVVVVDAPPPPDAAEIDAAVATGKLVDVDKETIGGFALGAKSDEVVKTLGQPKSKSKEETMGATGETVATWNFNGLAITMSKQDHGYVVNAIGVKAPSTAPTSRGIHIGSTRAEVEAVYQVGKDQSSKDPASFLVGSPFGGELFTFKKGVVTEIFLGAMAE